MSKPNLIYDYANTVEPLVIYNTIDTDNSIVKNLRQAAEVHKEVRKYIRKTIKPGMKYIDVCNTVEANITKIFGQNNKNMGLAFPVGLSVNEIAAHDSAVINDTRCFNKDDVIKIDFGTHVNGYIIDSAYTHTFNNKYENLVEATSEATWNAIKMAGPDTYIPDITKVIQETIESYEVDVNGKTHDVKAIYGLGGHNILQNTIHGGKIILSRSDYPKDYPIDQLRMKQDEIYAIETFASTGDGYVKQSDIPISHYMLNKNHNKSVFKFNITKTIYNWIISKRGTLPFSILWIDNDLKLGNKIKIGLNELINLKIITGYPALEDKKGTFTSQMEHTIYLHDKGKEILSHSNDY